MNVPIEQCTSAACYKPAPVRRYAFAALLVALYAWSLPFCYNTVGEPRAAAILRYQRLDDEKWATQSMQQVNSTSDPYGYLDEATDMDLSGGMLHALHTTHCTLHTTHYTDMT
jgi:hypothetical protein